MTRAAPNMGRPTERPPVQAAAECPPTRPLLCSIVVIAAYLAIGVVAFWPAYPMVSRHLFSDSPDLGQASWFLDWVPHALAHGDNPFFSNALFVPTGVNLAQNTATPLLAWVTAPFSTMLSPILKANLLIVLAMPISASAAFVVLRKWQVWLPAAALGGLAYGFSPYMVGQSDHLDLLFVPLPPFIALTVASILQGRGPWRRLGLQLGLLAAAQYFVSPEILASVAVLVVVAVAGVLIRRPANWSTVLRGAGGPTLVAFLVAFVLLAYPIWMGYFGPQHFTGPPVASTNPYHNDLLSLILPTQNQRVSLGVPPLRPDLLLPNENDGYIGLPVLVMVGVLAWWSRRSPRMQLAVVLMLASALLSFGPHLAIDGHLTDLPLPFWVLDHIPVLNSMLPGRISLEMEACVAAVIAFGLDDVRHTQEWCSRRRRSVALALVALSALVVTQLPPWPWHFGAQPAAALPTALTRAIPGGDPVAITYPYVVGASDAPMVWQAEDGFGFRLLGGYAFHGSHGGGVSNWPYPMKPAGLQGFLANQEGFGLLGPETPVSPQLVALTRSVLSKYAVRVVIVDRSASGSGAVMELFSDALGRPTASAGQFSLWVGWHARPSREQFSQHLSTAVFVPKKNAVLSGSVPLDAVGTAYYAITKVEFFLTRQGHSNLVAVGHATLIGWLAQWNTRTVANGTYTLQSKAYDEFGARGLSKGVTINVENPLPPRST